MSTVPFCIEPPHVRPEPAGAPLVDLSPLQEMGDPDLVVELAQLFVESTQPILVEMREALARGDSAAVARTAHSVKGASANMFVTHLVKAAAALEVAGKAGDLSAMLTLVDDVERHFAEAAAYLRTELSF